MSDDEGITGHYARAGIAQTILTAVRASLPEGREISVADLAPADEFHIGGIEATRRFVPGLALKPGMRVLDIGCGIGGTARFVAAETGAEVTGIDLTAEFIAAADALSSSLGLTARTHFHCGSALDMPFGDASFDGAFSLHVAMNIADKGALYREAARVLRPGAVLGIYDVLAGPGEGTFVFPVPWAAGPQASWLATPGEMRAALDGAGFDILEEEDLYAYALEFFARAAARGGPPPVGLHLLIGEGFAERIANLRTNLAARRCGPWKFVCRRR
jgi:SAM-dependent methyltransferase